MIAQIEAAEATLTQLSSRDIELRACLALAAAFRNRRLLGHSYKTVSNTFSTMKTKLSMSRTADLVRLAVRTKLA